MRLLRRDASFSQDSVYLIHFASSSSWLISKKKSLVSYMFLVLHWSLRGFWCHLFYKTIKIRLVSFMYLNSSYIFYGFCCNINASLVQFGTDFSCWQLFNPPKMTLGKKKIYSDQGLPYMGIHLFIIVLISPPHAFNQWMVQKAQDESDGMAEDLKWLGRVWVSAVCLEIN